MMAAAYVKNGEVVARFSGQSTVEYIQTQAVPEDCVLITNTQGAGIFVATIPALGSVIELQS